MIRVMDLERTLILAVLSAVIGICYKYAECWLILPLIIIVWSVSLSRLQAFFNMLVYYLVGSTDIILNIKVFFENTNYAVGLGLFCWFLVSLIMSVIWCAGWRKEGKYWSFIICIIAITVPPVGIISPVNPLCSVGYYFTGYGVMGIVFWFAIISFWLVCIEKQIGYRTIFAVCSLFLLILAFYPTHKAVNYKVHTINTHFQQVRSEQDNYYYFNRLTKLIIADVRKYKLYNTLIVLPETTGGIWSDANNLLWDRLSKKLADRNITVLIGAEILADTKYYNSLISVGKEKIALTQRVPVPISMYKPFSKDGAVADLFGTGKGQWQGKTFNYFICYEGMIVWPYLTSLFNKPDFVIGTSNLWFTNHNNTEKIQKNTLESFSRLWGVNYYQAINQ